MSALRKIAGSIRMNEQHPLNITEANVSVVKELEEPTLIKDKHPEIGGRM